MAIQDYFKSIKEALGEELASKVKDDLNAVEKLVSELETTVTRLEGEVDAAGKAKSKAESESIGRKKAVDILEQKLKTAEGEVKSKDATIADLNEKITNSSGTEDYEKMKTSFAEATEKLESLESRWSAVVAERKSTLQKEITGLMKSENPRFAKAKEYLALPKTKKEGDDLDWENWDDQDVDRTFTKMGEFRDLGYFDAGSETQPFSFYDQSVNNLNNDGEATKENDLNTPAEIMSEVKRNMPRH